MIAESGWFFTFGTNHVDSSGMSLGDRFVIVRNPDFNDAREILMRWRGSNRFAFQYPLSELPEQIANWGLREYTDIASLTDPKRVVAA
jgi:hypothetical protein